MASAHPAPSGQVILRRAVGAWLVLVAVLVGLPVLLVSVVGWPLPHHLPTLHGLAVGLDRPLAVGLLIKLLAVVAWLAWAQMGLAVVAAAIDLGHDRRRPRLVSARMQRLAAQLVASALLLAGPTAAAAAAVPRLAVSVPLVRVPARGPTLEGLVTTAPLVTSASGATAAVSGPSSPPGVGSAPASSTTPAQRSVTVAPGDNLWVLAERWLGDGARSVEIWNLNRDRVMTDGEVFTQPRLIRPGWVLLLPPDGAATSGPTGPADPVSASAPLAAPTLPVPPTTGADARGPAAETRAAGPSVPPARPAGGRLIIKAPPATGSKSPETTTTSMSAAAPPVRAQDNAGPEQADRRPSGPQHPIPPLGPIAGISGLVAAGVIWKLNRRRSERSFSRVRGQGIAPATAAATHHERRARVIAAEETMRWVDLGQRYLGRALAEEMPLGGALPSVVLVRVGTNGLEFMIEPRLVHPPGRFTAKEEGRVLRLDPDVDLAELTSLAAGRWSMLPTLVTVGESPEGTILANLEHAGSLAVQGDESVVAAVLAQMTLELATQPWTEETLSGLHLVGEAPALVGLPGVTVCPDPDQLAEQLDRRADRLERDLLAEPSLAAARALDGGWEPAVAVVLDPGQHPHALRCLLEAARPDRSGLALVTGPGVEAASWLLQLDADGTGVLRGRAGAAAFQLPLTTQARAETVDGLADALAATEELIVTAPVVSLRPVATPDERAGPEIQILGPPDVAGGGGPDALGAGRRSSALAVLAFVATHRQPVSSSSLADALWPLDESKDNFGQPSRGTVQNAARYGRKVLGPDGDGNEQLTFSGSGYRLGPDVGCDWLRFQSLVAETAGGPPGPGAQALRRALGLVRGSPFEGKLNDRYFEWVSTELLDLEIKAAVVDAAETLAELALAADEPAEAIWAVERGLMADPTREPLFGWWMRALGHQGDGHRLNEVYARLEDMLRRQVHPLQEPSPRSREIWASFQRPGGNRASAQ